MLPNYDKGMFALYFRPSSRQGRHSTSNPTQRFLGFKIFSLGEDSKPGTLSLSGSGSSAQGV